MPACFQIKHFYSIREKNYPICQFLRLLLRMDDSCHPVTQENHNAWKHGITDPRWEHSVNIHTCQPSLILHHSSYCFGSNRNKKPHWALSQGPHIIQRCSVPCRVRAHLIPKSRDSQHTALLTVHSEKPSWTHGLSCTSTSWPNLVCKKLGGWEPKVTKNQSDFWLLNSAVVTKYKQEGAANKRLLTPSFLSTGQPVQKT